jgi:hypothetical protein
MPRLAGYEDETTFTYCLEVEEAGGGSQQGRRFESLTYTCEVCDEGDGEVDMEGNHEDDEDDDGDDERDDEDDGDDGDDEDGEERQDGNRARYKRRRYAVSARQRGGAATRRHGSRAESKHPVRLCRRTNGSL